MEQNLNDLIEEYDNIETGETKFIRMVQNQKLRIHNPFNPPYGNNEAGGGISQTVPDQSMSVGEILKRYAKGLPLGGQKVPFYEDDDTPGMPDVNNMDLADRQTYFEGVKDEIANIQKQFNENKKIAAQKKLDDADKYVAGTVTIPTPKSTQPSGE